MEEKDSPSLIGQTLGHYRVVAKVGAGGMGEVYRARDQRLERDVAIKVLPAGTMGDDHARRRFRKEALALSRLNHPNIQTVFDFDSQRGVDFLASEFIEGVTLTQKLASGPLPIVEVVRLGTQLAEGLAAAHEHRIIHRDLKPSNLRITADGRLKILDFGLARRLQSSMDTIATEESTRSASETLSRPGTLPYMPPEVLRGAVSDERADIYSAGCTLYAMATGRRPFTGKVELELMEAIVHGKPPRPRSLRHDIPPDLEAIIQACMERNPEDRYPSARELLADLQQMEPTASGVVMASARRTRRLRKRTALGLAGAAAILVAGLAAVRLARGPETQAVVAPAARVSSLAVLPLENLSQDPEQDYFASGLTDALTTSLGRIHSLRVISRTSAMQFQEARRSVREIGRELGVDGLIEGSVLRRGDHVRVSARLIHAATDTQLWARTFERDLRDAFTLQQELALEIAGEVRTTVTPGEQQQLGSASPVKPAALEAYLKGSHLGRGTGEQRRRARQYFEQAVALDPDYAPGYAGLADTYWANLDLPPREAMARAKEHATRAVELDETLAHGHRALASVIFYGDWDWRAAEREFRRALELNPSDADAHRMFSVFLSAMGRHHEALDEIQTSLQLDPLSAGTRVTEGWTFYYARRWDDAIARCRQVAEVEPNSVGAQACLGATLLAKGALDEGLEHARAAADLSSGDAVERVTLGLAYARLGREKEAREVLDALRARASGTRYVPWYFQARILGALGDVDEAFAALERAYDERDLYMAWLKVDPAVDPLRDDPRLAALLERLRLPPPGA